MTATRNLGVLAAIGASMFMHAAYAADLAPAAPALTPAEEAALGSVSPWQIRIRALGVVPTDEGSVNGVAGSDLAYSKTVIPELDITYYFTDNIAAELILGTTRSGVWAEGSLASVGKVGSAWILPPTLTLQYHFTDFGAFKPYVGAGVNYTMFYNQKGDAAESLDVKNTFGAALQVGFDYMFDKNWGVNFDVKKIFLQPDFTARIGGNEISGKAKLDPWLIGAGLTYRF